jgi:uncharacterized protein with GYD domain
LGALRLALHALRAQFSPERQVPTLVTTGDADFLLITETNEAESAIAALLAAAAAGTISDVTTSRAWTGAEFKAVADKASKVASLYSPPGKK